MANVGDIWYRFEQRSYSHAVDEWGDRFETRTELQLHRFKVLKVTPKGVWLNLNCFGNKRFVLFTSRKRFACATLAEAKESFRARKARQIRIHQGIADEAKWMINQMENGRAQVANRFAEEKSWPRYSDIDPKQTALLS